MRRILGKTLAGVFHAVLAIQSPGYHRVGALADIEVINIVYVSLH